MTSRAGAVLRRYQPVSLISRFQMARPAVTGVTRVARLPGGLAVRWPGGHMAATGRYCGMRPSCPKASGLSPIGLGRLADGGNKRRCRQMVVIAPPHTWLRTTTSDTGLHPTPQCVVIRNLFIWKNSPIHVRIKSKTNLKLHCEKKLDHKMSLWFRIRLKTKQQLSWSKQFFSSGYTCIVVAPIKLPTCKIWVLSFESWKVISENMIQTVKFCCPHCNSNFAQIRPLTCSPNFPSLLLGVSMYATCPK